MSEAIKADWAKFTDKQRACVAGFIKHGNKLKAYREAYDVADDYAKSVQRNCYSFFQKPHIKAIVSQIQEQAVKRAAIQFEDILDGNTDEIIEKQKELDGIAIDAAWVLRRIGLLADFNIRSFIRVHEGNAVYDFSEATDDDWYCIQEYTTEEINRGKGDDIYQVEKVKVKAIDKLRALELVGKHIAVQAFKEQTVVTGEIKHRTLGDFYDDNDASSAESES